MDLIKEVQIILAVLFEHRVQMAIILTFISIFKVFFNITIFYKGANNIKNKNNKKNKIFSISER